MAGRTRRRGFTLIELLVVMTVMLMLAGLLMVGVKAAIVQARRTQTQAEIGRMMLALAEYFNEFDAYPPGGSDVADDGNLDDTAGDDLGAGKVPADPDNPTAVELQLRTLCVQLPVEGGIRTVGPYYTSDRANVAGGALVDVFGSPFRYLADGRRTTFNPATGKRLPGRVLKRGPVIWSVAQDRTHDPLNNKVDDDANGKVDDRGELHDDLCGWN